jgi:hypothetical protein
MDDKKKIEVLEQKLRLYEQPGEMRAYYALRRIVNAQVDYLNGFQIETHIGADPKEDKVYDRAEKIWKSLKELTADLQSLKTIVKATDDESVDIRRPFVDMIAEKRE